MDKLLTIHDGTVCDVNPWIKGNQHYRTTAPRVQDVMTALFQCSFIPTTILKLDVTKANRQINILQRYRKFMTAKINGTPG